MKGKFDNCRVKLIIVVVCLLVAPEKETEDLTKTGSNFTQDGEQISEAQEEDGDWEQVGPRNKSMVTRMVKNELNV